MRTLKLLYVLFQSEIKQRIVDKLNVKIPEQPNVPLKTKMRKSVKRFESSYGFSSFSCPR